MVGVRRFQDLRAWQFSTALCVAVHEITKSGPAYDDEEFRDQIRDAAKSAPALIAEGFTRFTTREFVRYLRMARAELAEVQSALEVGDQMRYFPNASFERTKPLADQAMATTTALLKSKVRKLEEDSKRQDERRRRRT